MSKKLMLLFPLICLGLVGCQKNEVIDDPEPSLATLSIGMFENGQVIASQTDNLYEGLEITLTAIPDNGYELETLTFNNVVQEVTNNEVQVTLIAGENIVNATFVEEEETIVPVPDPEPALVTLRIGTFENGQVIASQTTNLYEGLEITLTAIPNEGYELERLTFNNVIQEVTDNEVQVILISGENIVDASFIETETEVPDPSPAEASLSIGTFENGQVIASQTDNLYEGLEVTLTAIPDEGYELETLTFNNVMQDVTNNQVQVTLIAGENIVSATFVAIEIPDPSPASASLTIGTFENGQVIASQTDNLYEGLEITLTAIPNDGYDLEILTFNNVMQDVSNNQAQVTLIAGENIVSATFIEIETPEPSVTFHVNESGTLTGADNATGDIAIPEEVDGITITSIGSEAFSDNTEITSISLPNTITLIGYRAFYRCTSLTSIDVWDGVITISTEAFYGCTSLSEMSFPGSLTTIGQDAFTSIAITSLDLKNVTSIGQYAFKDCTRLSKLDLSSVEFLGRGAFQGCTSLDNIYLPETISSTEGYIFSECSSLSNVTITSNGIPLDYTAFDETPLTSEESDNWKDNGLLIIDGYVFRANDNFTGTVTLDLEEGIVGIAANALNNLGGGAGKVNSLTTVNFPSTIKNIGEKAFSGCSALSIISIPEGVKLNGVGSDAFEDTAILENSENYDNHGLYLANYLIAVEDTSFTTFTIKEGTEYISDYTGGESQRGLFSATAASSVEVIIFPNTLLGIGEKVFGGLSNVASLEFPESLVYISEDAFRYCSSLTTINFENCLNLTTIGAGAFLYCDLTNVIIPNNVEIIGSFTFNFNDNLEKIYCEALEKPSGWADNWNYCRGTPIDVEWGYAIA